MDINWSALSTKAQKNAETAQNDALVGLMGALDDLVANDGLSIQQRTTLALQLTAALNAVQSGGQLSLGSAAPAPTQQPTPTQAPPTSDDQSAEATRVIALENAIKDIAGHVGASIVLNNGQSILANATDAIKAAVDRKVANAESAARTAATLTDGFVKKSDVWTAIEAVQPFLLDGDHGFHRSIIPGHKSMADKDVADLRTAFGKIEVLARPGNN